MSKSIVTVLLFSIFILSNGCNISAKKEEHLARKNCGSCHQFPDPSLLDKKSWKESVLPEMAFRMGMNNEALFSVPHRDLQKVLTTLPAEALLSREEWESIRNYFIKNAPDSLSIPEKSINTSISQFTVLKQSFPFYLHPLITSLKVDTANHKIYMGDRKGVLHQFNSDFKLEDHTQLASPPSHIVVDRNNRLIISLMGIMEPNDQAYGAMVSLESDLKAAPLIDSLQRPVHFEKIDLNNDGEDDFIICAFGNYTGQLLTFEKKGDHFIRHTLSAMPGARNVVIKDVNKDGLIDILVLMTQGDERIALFMNKGNFSFQEKTLLRFPPVYGSSYFEIQDFNKDGHFDILYTNGDNADYSTVLKPYHGIKLYLNDGALNFKKSWSYPMYGASQARAIDFDHDGDFDIAAISFFPDFEHNSEESFIYFENTGNNQFNAQITSLASSGRWLVMEAEDYDNDGDCDILLGAFNLVDKSNKLSQQWMKDKTAILLLENNLN